MPQPLDDSALAEALLDLSGWAIEDGKLAADFKFKDFDKAMAFINQVADIAKQLNHHPEWANVYNKVQIRLVTHDAGNRITDLDIQMATTIHKMAVVAG